MRIAMNSRGMSGKWNDMWHSSPCAEVGDCVFGPLVGLRQQHPVAVVVVDVLAELSQEGVRLGQVLAVGALALVQVGDGVEPHAVDAHVDPEVEGFEDRLMDLRVVEVEVRLVRVEAVPVVRVRDVIPGPVGRLEVLEDDPRVLVLSGSSRSRRRSRARRCPAWPGARAETRGAGPTCGCTPAR